MGEPLVRIGLSATQRPIEKVARFLVGRSASCAIIDSGHRREMDVAIELPGAPLEAVMSNEVWEEVYRRLAELVEAHRTTLIFVNTRRLAERTAHHLGDLIGKKTSPTITAACRGRRGGIGPEDPGGPDRAARRLSRARRGGHFVAGFSGERVPALAGNRVLYDGGIPIATLVGGNVSFLVELEALALQVAERDQRHRDLLYPVPVSHVDEPIDLPGGCRRRLPECGELGVHGVLALSRQDHRGRPQARGRQTEPRSLMRRRTDVLGVGGFGLDDLDRPAGRDPLRFPGQRPWAGNTVAKSSRMLTTVQPRCAAVVSARSVPVS